MMLTDVFFSFLKREDNNPPLPEQNLACHWSLERLFLKPREFQDCK